MISLDLMKSSEVRKVGDRSKYHDDFENNSARSYPNVFSKYNVVLTLNLLCAGS